MSYHVRNRNRPQSEGGAGQDWEWTFLKNGRVSNSNSEDKLTEDENGNLLLVQKDEAAFMSLSSFNEPVVTYSARTPNYPIEYSCEHTVLYSNNNKNGYDAATNEAEMMSNSEGDGDDEKEAIGLSDTRVQMSLEFEIPTTVGNYDEVASNVEALQWSILNEVASRSGLSKDCNVEVQYDEQTLLTALTTMNELHTTNSQISHDSSLSPSPSPSPNNNHSNSEKKRRLRRTLRINRSLLSSLPYPTSVYVIGSNRPKWTGKFIAARYNMIYNVCLLYSSLLIHSNLMPRAAK